MSKIWGCDFCQKKTAEAAVPRNRGFLSGQATHSEVTAKNAAAEHVRQFGPGRHVQNWGLQFLLERKQPEAAVPGNQGFCPARPPIRKLPRKMQPQNMLGQFLTKINQVLTYWEHQDET